MTNKMIENVQTIYSMTLVVFSTLVITAFNAEGQTQVAKDIQPVVSLLVMWVSIMWLSVLEGGECSILNFKSIKPERFKESHPITSTIFGYKSELVNRFLLGRQFLVIIIIFTINICGAPIADAHVVNVPSWIQNSFIESGIAITSIIVILGQLPSQLNAWHCMLDYTNNSFMTFTLYVALIMEASGILHMVHLFQYFLYWLSGKPLETNEGPRSHLQALFFWGRCILSMAIFAFSMAVTLHAIWQEQTTTWDRVPNVVAVIFLVVLFLVGGMLEGIKVAYIAVSKLPKSQREVHPMAKQTCDLLFHDEKHGLPGFWVGRQMFATLCFVIIARMTKVNVDMGVEENIFGVSDGLQKLFNLGYLGAIITAIMGSLLWQLVASVYPLEFLSNPLSYVLIRLCVWLEASAVCSAYRLIGTIYKEVAGFELDEVYIGSTENDHLSAMDEAEFTLETGNSMKKPQMKTPTGVLKNKVAPAKRQTPDHLVSEELTSQNVVLEPAVPMEEAVIDVTTEQRIIEAKTMDDLESGE